MEDADTKSTAIHQELAEDVVLDPTTASLATCPRKVPLSQPTTQIFNLQASRASLGDAGYPPLEYIDVSMDNLILLTLGPLEQQQQQLRQILLGCLG